MQELLQQVQRIHQRILGGSTEPDGAAASAPAAQPSHTGSHRHEAQRATEAGEDEDLSAACLDEPASACVAQLTAQPSSMVGGTLRQYQLDGLNWCVQLYHSQASGMLADEMGLGKTIQSIAMLAYLRQHAGVTAPFLVIAPKSTLSNWNSEMAKWCPSLSVLVLQGDKRARAELMAAAEGSLDVVLLSFETVLIEFAWLQRQRWGYLIMDEAHRIKNEQSKLSQRVRALESGGRLLLTGTPLQNSLHELWALLHFLMPTIFHDSSVFDEWFVHVEAADSKPASPQDSGATDLAVRALHAVLRPFILRRLKSEVAKHLPAKSETTLYVPMSGKQRELYKAVLSKHAILLNELTATTSAASSAASGNASSGRASSQRAQAWTMRPLANILTQLRKVCNHPYLFDGVEPGPPFENGPHLWDSSGKLSLLHRLLERLIPAGHRVLIFCQMTRMLDILEDYMAVCSIPCARLDGSTPAWEREQAIDAFQQPDSDIACFLLSTRAGGLGLNLTGADTVVLYDSDFNPQMDLQAQDRAHRIGQTRPVRVFRLVCDGTVEEKILERAARKLYLDALVVQQGRLAMQAKALSHSELETMIRFGANEIFRARSAVTCEDLDALLAQGEQRTRELSESIRTDMQHSLDSFSLQDLSNVPLLAGLHAGSSQQAGPTAGAPAGPSAASSLVLELPAREKSKNMSVNAKFRELLDGTEAGAKSAKPGVRRGRKPDWWVQPPAMEPHQFFDAARIRELCGIENAVRGARAEAEKAAVELLKTESRSKRGWVADRVSHLVRTERMTAHAANATACAEWDARCADPAQSEAAAAAAALNGLPSEPPAAVVAEREALVAAGFGSWSKSDLRAYIAACEMHGRADVDSVARSTAATTGHSPSDVLKYHAVFWQRIAELPKHEAILAKVAAGEQRLAADQQARQMLLQAARQHEHPMMHAVDARSSAHARGQWRSEHDTWLLCFAADRGLTGTADPRELQAAVQRLYPVPTDLWMRSRSGAALAKRLDTIVRSLGRQASSSEDTTVLAGTKRARSE